MYATLHLFSDFDRLLYLFTDSLRLQIPDCGLLCDLLWSDPDKDITGWSENDRGVSFTFGPDVVSRFLQKHDMDLICRAHQVVEDGYEFFSKRQLVTLFSAPNYCGEFDNAGAMMSVDESLLCSFQILKPAEKKQKYVVLPLPSPPDLHRNNFCAPAKFLTDLDEDRCRLPCCFPACSMPLEWFFDSLPLQPPVQVLFSTLQLLVGFD